MEFRLTYAGPLFSTANDSKGVRRADHKHAIRMMFHPQLKRLWEVTPFLKKGMTSGPYEAEIGGWNEGEPQPHTIERLSKKHAKFNWNFVPLVTTELQLLCAIDVLFLRPQRPGGIVDQGDIDGRLKTLIDALSIPDSNQAYSQRSPGKRDNPVFVLLEDDRLVSKISVETDQLLEFTSSRLDINDVRLVITVRIRPYEMHAGNLPFG